MHCLRRTRGLIEHSGPRSGVPRSEVIRGCGLKTPFHPAEDPHSSLPWLGLRPRDCRDVRVRPAAPPLQALVDYLEEVQTTNPGLKAFASRYEAARERTAQSRALPDPVFQVTHFVESVQTRTGPQESALSLSQRIPWFGKLDQRGVDATAAAEAVWYAWQSRQLAVALEVTDLFFDYGFNERARHLTARSLQLLEQFEPVVTQKVRAGGALNDLLRLKVEIGRTGDTLASLEQERRTLVARLNAMLARPSDAPLPAPQWDRPVPLPPAPSADLARAMERHHPELNMIQRQIESADARREIARLERFPDLMVGVNTIQVGHPSANPATPGAGRDPWSVTLAVSLPVWTARNQATQAEAVSNHRALTQQYEDRLNHLRADLSSSLARLDDAHRRLKLYGDELLGLARQALDKSRSAYENGGTILLEVIDSERSLLELELQHWRAAADAWQQRITVQSLINQPLLGSFAAPSDHE